MAVGEGLVDERPAAIVCACCVRACLCVCMCVCLCVFVMFAVCCVLRVHVRRAGWTAVLRLCSCRLHYLHVGSE